MEIFSFFRREINIFSRYIIWKYNGYNMIICQVIYIIKTALNESEKRAILQIFFQRLYYIIWSELFFYTKQKSHRISNETFLFYASLSTRMRCLTLLFVEMHAFNLIVVGLLISQYILHILVVPLIGLRKGIKQSLGRIHSGCMIRTLSLSNIDFNVTFMVKL